MIKELRSKKLNQVLFALGGLLLLGAAVLAVVLFQRAGYSQEAADYHTGTEVYKPVVVDFEPLSTTEEEYDRMYQECTEYMAFANAQAEGSAAENTVIDVSEDTYFDSEQTDSGMEKNVAVEYREYDRVYFESLLVLRFVNEFGEIQVIGARLDEKNEDTAEVLTQEELQYDHFNAENWWDWAVSPQAESKNSDDDAISQDAYISCIEQCVAQILTGEEDFQRIRSHFTDEGEMAVRRTGQVLGISSGSVITLQLGVAGKSDLEYETMDRLYLRYEITRNGEVSYLNMLLKLNQNTMIFDVDII